MQRCRIHDYRWARPVQYMELLLTSWLETTDTASPPITTLTYQTTRPDLNYSTTSSRRFLGSLMPPGARLSNSQKRREQSASCFTKVFGNLATEVRRGKARGLLGCNPLLVEIWLPGWSISFVCSVFYILLLLLGISSSVNCNCTSVAAHLGAISDVPTPTFLYKAALDSVIHIRSLRWIPNPAHVLKYSRLKPT